MAHGAVEAVGAGIPGEIWSVAALTTDAWSVRPEVAAPLLLAASAYAIGWWRLRRRGGSVPGTRVAAYASGLLSLVVALSAPLDHAAHASFAAHMAQHLLLIVAAAPLLLLADPFSALLWALPWRLRTATGRLLRSGTPLRRLGCGLTLMTVAWLAHVVTIWLWHLPGPYDAAVADRLVHDLEHLAFLGTAVLFWWPIVQPAPRLRARSTDGARVGYLVLAALQGGFLGLLLTLSPEAWYRSYASTADQSLGGLIMWGVGGAIDMLVVLIVMARYLASQDRPALTY
jgi:cytochrome c oxidase assembly factor CtaG